MTYKAFFDGACYNNTCGVGFFILNSSGYIIHKTSRFYGRGDALNAEYMAFILLLGKLVDLNVEQVVINGDSQTVVRQVKGLVNTRKTNRFLPIIRQARRILAERPRWRVNWVPRRQNGLADALATEGLYSRECA